MKRWRGPEPEPLQARAKLLNGGEVQFTDSKQVKMFIRAEHAKAGGWTLSVIFPGGETVFIDLPSRGELGNAMEFAGKAMRDLSVVMAASPEPYDWKHKT